MSAAANWKLVELLGLLRLGRRLAVSITSAIDDNEGYAEGGMRAELVGAERHHHEVLVLTLDFSSFEHHNSAFEKANWRGGEGHGTVTARQGGFYRPVERYHFDPMRSFGDYFSLLDEQQVALFEEYRTAGAQLSYVDWLERRVLFLSGKGAFRER